jgi:DNA-directed RNA polymerase specialized sigma24 family protein
MSRGRMWPVDDATLDTLRQTSETTEDHVDFLGAVDDDGCTAVRRAVERLAPAERHLILLLTKSDTVDYRSISEAIGRPIGSIGPTRMRVLAKLRRDRAIRQLAELDTAT